MKSRDKWNIASWKRGLSNSYPCAELKIKGGNIVVGHAREKYGDKDKTIVSAKLSNISGGLVEVDESIHNITDDQLLDAWEKAFAEVDQKLLK